MEAPERGPRPAFAAAHTLVEALHERGWWVAPDWLSPELVRQLADELHARDGGGELEAAGIGRGGEHIVAPAIRGDRTRWLDGSTLAQCRFLHQMKAIQDAINRALFLGLFEFEAHFALYPPGAGYARHYDSLRGAANRVVSVVAYLNPGWARADGGELVLYRGGARRSARVVRPAAGTLAVFLSETIAHEVRPARRTRTSIAGWFRVNQQRPDAPLPEGAGAGPRLR